MNDETALRPGTTQRFNARSDPRLDWWRDAKFGMFIHWGLYAIPAGEWQGEDVPGLGAWIMHRARIPVAEYEQLAGQFNPVGFDADAWVSLAKKAGQKYIVITAKHHDGFCLFKSEVTDYNIVDATPFGRDVIAELAEACRKQDIKLGFYYSQTQDWHHPDGDGNDWDYVEANKDFTGYIENYVKPQVRELLTNYGPICLIWFDTPRRISPGQSQSLVDLVHELQPDCLVNGRVGNAVGDYASTADNQIPVSAVSMDWETPATINDSWGYRADDYDWKSPEDLIRKLVDIVSKGGNYLLNVGPTAEGLIPEPSVERLLAIGEWLDVNGESIYGTRAGPIQNQAWCRSTSKPGKIYMHVFDWPKRGEIQIPPLSKQVTGAYILSDPIHQQLDLSVDAGVMSVHGPDVAPDPADSVAVLRAGVATDTRLLTNGWEIPSEGYCDQPYIVKTDDGAWLCVMTTGAGKEGQPGQHVVTTRSIDQGRSWSPLVDIEPADGPEASYAVLLKAPRGRIFAFYNHNSDNVREIDADEVGEWAPNGKVRRVDSLGHFVFKYSDDHGRTWSKQRYDIPIRLFEIDRENIYGGKLLFFWNVGRPFVIDGAAYISIHKVGGFGEGFFNRSEGALLRSPNLLTEPDPEKIVWETLPEGGIGLRAPAGGGPIAEEQSYSVLNDGSIYCVYRTIDGHPACSYSRDGGRTWSEPQYKRYPDGRLMKHPRAANFAWRCENGKYLYWFHNHGGRSYDDRNPVWLCGGVETDTPEGKVILWSQPEIALYDDDPYIRMSYPDLVEDGGQYYLTETQKCTARVHLIDKSLLEGLWSQFDPPRSTTEDCLLELGVGDGNMPESVVMPALPRFIRRDRDPDSEGYGTLQLRTGISIEVELQLDSLVAGQVLLDNRTANGQGFCLQTGRRQTIEINLNDGRSECHWDCDPGMIEPGRRHHLVVIVDAGPRIITFITDGKLNDGGAFRQFGWGRFSPNLREANGRNELTIGNGILSVRIFGRALHTSEAVNNYRSLASSSDL